MYLWDTGNEPGFCSGLLAAWGPENQAWILDSLTYPATRRVTQVLLSLPEVHPKPSSCHLALLYHSPELWSRLTLLRGG